MSQRRFISKNGGHELLLHCASMGGLLLTMMQVAGFERKGGKKATLWESSTVALMLRAIRPWYRAF